MKFSMVLLGAGNSKRFGENKLLYEINGKKMFEYSIDLSEKLRRDFPKILKNIIIVSKYKEIEEYAKLKNIIYVENLHSEMGISSSIFLGVLESEKLKNNYMMFMVCDQPYLKYQTLKNFIENFFKQNKNIGVVSFRKAMGNPCIFSSKYIKNLKNLTGDVGGKKIIKENLDDVYCYEVLEEKELEDIDFLNKNA